MQSARQLFKKYYYYHKSYRRIYTFYDNYITGIIIHIVYVLITDARLIGTHRHHSTAFFTYTLEYFFKLCFYSI